MLKFVGDISAAALSTVIYTKHHEQQHTPTEANPEIKSSGVGFEHSRNLKY